MNCAYCGEVLSDGARFCKSCGNEVVSNVHLGYSTRINDPAFAKYIGNTKKWAILFSVIIAVIAIIGFTIAGEVSDEVGNPQSMFIGFGIGGMFLTIALVQVISKNRSKTWDGQVVDKRIEQKKRKVNQGNDDYYWQKYILFIVFIRRTDGKTFEIRVEDNDTIYNYYHINDYVRHHGELDTYEKYDKSQDSIIFCNACSTLHNIQDEYCHRCKCPLLK